MTKRSCGTCTKCCEGWLTGKALGYTFYTGKPCHYISVGKGCTVYSKRPQDPCIAYKCQWLANEDIPEWMKPSDINAIIDIRNINGIEYIKLIEAGSILDSKALSWFIQYAFKKKFNFVWVVNGSDNWIGTSEFIQAMENQLNPNHRSVH
jgi:hypothetical protein